MLSPDVRPGDCCRRDNPRGTRAQTKAHGSVWHEGNQGIIRKSGTSGKSGTWWCYSFTEVQNERYLYPTQVRVMESVFKYDLPNEPELGPPEDYRYDTIHLYGIHTDFSTKTIYQYFTGYSPMKVEWLNDTSANIVFADPNACKRALTCFSLAIPGELERIRDKEPEHAQREDLEFILWRKAKPCQGHRLLMRVCHKEDVKKPLQDRKPS
eukprot:1351319-Amorphochlora_amoeboformis.AAC.2